MNLKYCKNGMAILLAVVIGLILVSTCVSGAELAKDTQAPPGKTITLAKGGITEYVIVEGDNPILAERTAAAEELWRGECHWQYLLSVRSYRH